MMACRDWANLGKVQRSVELAKLKGISYGYLNTRSLFEYYDDIVTLLERTKLGVLMFGETSLNYSITNQTLEIEGYNLIPLPRIVHVIKIRVDRMESDKD